MNQRERLEFAQRLISTPEDQPVHLHTDPTPNRNSIQAADLIHELNEMNPFLVQLAAERILRKRLEQENKLLVRAMEENSHKDPT